MQTTGIENSLNLSVLPINAQRELIDFYEFLVNKYTDKHNIVPLVKPMENKNIHALKGVFIQYANPAKTALEKSVWQKHLLNKYADD
jgi:hypothetical protein